MIRTGTAIHAEKGVDVIFIGTFTDCLYRAFILAGSAGNTIISNNVSHSFLFPPIFAGDFQPSPASILRWSSPDPDLLKVFIPIVIF
jgi:hypothetical protein